MTQREHDSGDLAELARLREDKAKNEALQMVYDHKEWCIKEGPLAALKSQVAAQNEKVDKLQTSSTRQNAVLGFLTVVGPIVLGLLLNSSSNSRLQKQIDVAADVARTLKDLQDATHHSELTPGTVHQSDTRIANIHTPEIVEWGSARR